MLSNPRTPIPGPGLKLHSRSFPFALEQAIAKCNDRIYFCCYVLTGNENRKSDPVINILEKCKHLQDQSQVDVRFAIDLPLKKSNNWNCNHHFMRYLRDAGIPFKCSPNKGTLHAKMILIDSNHVFVGSHNMAMSSFWNPLELTVEINDSEFIDKCARDYLAWWKTLFVPTCRSGG